MDVVVSHHRDTGASNSSNSRINSIVSANSPTMSNSSSNFHTPRNGANNGRAGRRFIATSSPARQDVAHSSSTPSVYDQATAKNSPEKCVKRGLTADNSTADVNQMGRENLLVEAATISNGVSGDGGTVRDGDRDRPSLLQKFHSLITCTRATEIVRDSLPSFVGNLLVHLTKLLPEAMASPDHTSMFIDCMGPFEDHEEFVLCASFYKAIGSMEESAPSPRRGHNRKRYEGNQVDSLLASAPKHSPMTGLQTLRGYLCMDMIGPPQCSVRTVMVTLTRALLGAWEGSIDVGRQLFDHYVLKRRDCSGMVSVGLEVLLQCLVQGDCDRSLPQTLHGDSPSSSEDRSPRRSNSESDSDSAEDQSETTRRHRAKLGNTRRSRDTMDETRTCMALVGNYVRADVNVATLFFQDMLPKILLINAGGGKSLERVPPRLAAMLRALVETTRARTSFNMERLVMQSVKYVKSWGDPSALLAATSSAASGAPDSDVFGEENKGAPQPKKPRIVGVGAKEKRYRRALVLACLEIIGPSASCMSFIRRHMVDNESKSNLRAAVVDALSDYSRTCDKSDVDSMQVQLEALSALTTDGSVSVRLSALAGVREICSPESPKAAILLLERCLDASPKVRCLAVRIMVDDFLLVGTAGSALARAVLLPTRNVTAATGGATNRTGERERSGKGRVGAVGYGGFGGGATVHEADGILGRMLRQYEQLKETDGERFPTLLKALVAATLRDDSCRDGGTAHALRLDIASIASDMNQQHRREPNTSVCGTGQETGRGDDARSARTSWRVLERAAARLSAVCCWSELSQYNALNAILRDLCCSAPTDNGDRHNIALL